MDDSRRALLVLLADGAWHSGVRLGAALGLSRAAIWKQVRALRDLGLVIVTDRRYGYRLDAPLQLLAADSIRIFLHPAVQAVLTDLDVLLITSSTSDHLTAMAAPDPGRMLACVAEYQSGGRGRRGRRWFSPLGQGLCLSVAWRYEVAPRDLAALGLVVGVAVTEALADFVPAEVIKLKWPNDIVADGGKLGGILVDVAGETGGPLRVVIGIGLNVHASTGLGSKVDGDGGSLLPATLDMFVSGGQVSRNQLAGGLLNALHRNLIGFASSGFAPFAPRWRGKDYLQGQSVTVTSGSQTFCGIARGIADDGAMMVTVNDALIPVYSGDVTLRRQP